MQSARGHFLAGPGFAREEYGGAAVADQFDDFHYFAHGAAGTDQQVAPSAGWLQRGTRFFTERFSARLPLRLPDMVPDRHGHEFEQLFRFDRVCDVLESTPLGQIV